MLSGALMDALVGSAHAESVKDAVAQHLDEGLAKRSKPAPAQKAAPPPAPRRQEPARRQNPPPQKQAIKPGEGFHWSTDDKPEKPEPVDPDPLPHRLFGDNLKLDPKAGAGYRGWLAQDYPRVAVPHTGYFTWSMEVKGRFFRYIALHRGYYESNGLAAPRNQTAQTAAQVGQYAPKAAWLLGAIGLEISPAWQPIISYETRAFESTAIPKAPVRIVPYDAPEDTNWQALPATTAPLRMVSGFETFIAGVRYDASKSSSAVIGGKGSVRRSVIPPFYLGVGLIQYAKPYQVSVGSGVLSELLFNARFRGAGLAFGFDTPELPDRVSINFAGQTGIGEVRLLRTLTVNEGLPADWLIGYAQGNLTVGYLYPLLRTKPTVFLSGALNGGGITFFYFKTKREPGEQTTSPAANWDFLWGARASVIIPL
jgi:hypothetical protein